ncbi:MAG: succinate dehydrogenase iron-sulfur subunit [Chloroflexi bacterium]|nr:MAG: succinate dehydrogenase iron-sulfur subunit [Chloroflexota bacterium]
MKVTLKIQRYNPEQDRKPHFETYVVEQDPTDRVLDALNTVKWQHDGTLTYRRSCAHGVCGSDAMQINGRNRLACKVLIQDVGTNITVEPVLGFRVIKDLVVDMEPFFASYRLIKPFLITSEPAPTGRERHQSQEDRDLIDDTSKCILCAACTTACPITWTNEEFVGPAAIVQAHRFIYDSRDQGKDDRLNILNDRSGVWRCRTIFNCTDACPRGIKITKAIEQVKRTILFEGP